MDVMFTQMNPKEGLQYFAEVAILTMIKYVNNID